MTFSWTPAARQARLGAVGAPKSDRGENGEVRKRGTGDKSTS